jgi:hypothetical protein
MAAAATSIPAPPHALADLGRDLIHILPGATAQAALVRTATPRGGRALIGDFPKGFWPYLLIAALSLRRVRRPEAPQMIFVVRNGHGNHMRRRRLWPLHLGGVVIVRCELCNIVRRQRWTRWEQMSEPLNAPASGNWRSTNYRH